MITCADFEILLCDYIDETLNGERRAALERHRQECKACYELARDVIGAVAFIDRAEQVQPPQELMTRITFAIPRESQATRRLKSI